jgi:hypothetical protein
MKQIRLIKTCLNETYNKTRTGKNLSVASSSTLQNSPFETFKKVGRKLNEPHQLLVCADHVNLLTIKKITEALSDASKKVGLEADTEKSKCMLMSHHQNAEQNHIIKMPNT